MSLCGLCTPGRADGKLWDRDLGAVVDCPCCGGDPESRCACDSSDGRANEVRGPGGVDPEDSNRSRFL